MSTSRSSTGEHQGRVVVMVGSASWRGEAALLLAKKTASPVRVFEVIGSSGPNRCRFRTEAWDATPAGELKTAEGAELDLEDPGGWIGDLSEQAHQVLEAFARFEYGPLRSETRSFKKRKPGKPSSPRVAALFASLQKAKSHEGVPQPRGSGLRAPDRSWRRGESRRGYCSAAEYEELERLLGG